MDELTCRRLQDEGAVERYVADTLSGEELDEFESHLIECPHCQQEVRLGAAVRQAFCSAETHDRIRSGGRLHLLKLAGGVGLAAAAALTVLLATPQLRRAVESNGHRAPLATPAQPLITPRGVVATLDTARWHAVPGAERYRVKVFDGAGHVLWEAETTDTVLHVSGLEDLQSETPYYWQVETRVGWDRWENSELVEFQLSPRQPGERSSIDSDSEP